MRIYVTLLLSVALSLPMTACSEKSTGADIEGVGTHKKEQVNIIGKVTCEGKGIANAVVSDGVEVVKTNDMENTVSFLKRNTAMSSFQSLLDMKQPSLETNHSFSSVCQLKIPT